MSTCTGKTGDLSDGSRGVPRVPWNLPFEGLPSCMVSKSAHANIITYTTGDTQMPH